MASNHYLKHLFSKMFSFLNVEFSKNHPVLHMIVHKYKHCSLII